MVTGGDRLSRVGWVRGWDCAGEVNMLLKSGRVVPPHTPAVFHHPPHTGPTSDLQGQGAWESRVLCEVWRVVAHSSG